MSLKIESFETSAIDKFKNLNLIESKNALHLELFINSLEHYGNLPLDQASFLELSKFKDKLQTEFSERLDLIEKVKNIFSFKITHLGKNNLSVIFGFLDTQTLANLEITCKAFKCMLDEDKHVLKRKSIEKFKKFFQDKELTFQEKDGSLHVLARHEIQVHEILHLKRVRDVFRATSHLGLCHLNEENVKALVESFSSFEDTPTCLLISDAHFNEAQLNTLLAQVFNSNKPLTHLYLHRIKGLSREMIVKAVEQHKAVFQQEVMRQKKPDFELIEDQPLPLYAYLLLDGNWLPYQNFLTTFSASPLTTPVGEAFEKLPIPIQHIFLQHVCIGFRWEYPAKESHALDLLKTSPHHPLIFAAAKTAGEQIISRECVV